MSRDLKALIRDATVIESLDPKPTREVKAAWSREIERRVREIEEGSVELADWEEVRAELFADAPRLPSS